MNKLEIPESYIESGIIKKCPCCRIKRDANFFFGKLHQDTYKCFKCNEYARALAKRQYVPNGLPRGRKCKAWLAEQAAKAQQDIVDIPDQ